MIVMSEFKPIFETHRKKDVGLHLKLQNNNTSRSILASLRQRYIYEQHKSTLG